jgi:four helix bundle protein
LTSALAAAGASPQEAAISTAAAASPASARAMAKERAMNDNRAVASFGSTGSTINPSSRRGSPSGAGPVSLPHHRLVAYSVALELLAAVRRAAVRDPKLRDEALRSAKSACLNAAEGAGRVSRPDKARSFSIARAEAGEAAAAVEIAASCGDAPAAASAEVNRIADRLVALLTGLVR